MSDLIPRPDRSTSASDAEPTEVVAIDGPSGAGKSTVARALADALGFAYLDTGAMYRAVTWVLLQRQLGSLDDTDAVVDCLDELDLRLLPRGRVLVGETDVTSHLRSREVESRVSAVSALPVVRERMRDLQREIARRAPVVAEGRDMATVVFPLARFKFYLDADAGERARRRRVDFVARGRDVSEAEVLEEILVRDGLDSSRKDAPLRRADDARMVDTTGLPIDEVVTELLSLVREPRSQGAHSVGTGR